MTGTLKPVRGWCEAKRLYFLSLFFFFFFSYTLFQWIVAYDCIHISTFHDFYNIFSFYVEVFLWYTVCVLGCTCWFLMKFHLLIKNKKKMPTFFF
jgi:hypothetical protein